MQRLLEIVTDCTVVVRQLLSELWLWISN